MTSPIDAQATQANARKLSSEDEGHDQDLGTKIEITDSPDQTPASPPPSSQLGSAKSIQQNPESVSLGVRELRVFVPACALLMTILFVWANLWTSVHGRYALPDTVFLGLTWTYVATGFALLALLAAIWLSASKGISEVRGWPFGFFVAALSMAPADVAEAIFSALWKFAHHKPIDEALIKFADTKERLILLSVFLATALLIAGLSIAGE